MAVKNKAVIAMNMILLLTIIILMKTTTMMKKKIFKENKTRTLIITVTMRVKRTVDLSKKKKTANNIPTARKKVIQTKMSR